MNQQYFIITLNLILLLSIFFIVFTLFKKVSINVLLFGGIVCLLISKINVILLNAEIDLDESIHLVQAFSILKYGTIYWKELASGSSGPTNTYIIVLGGLIFGEVNWRLVHLIYTLLLITNWLLFYNILKNTTKNTELIYSGLTYCLTFFFFLQNYYLLNFHTELLGFTLIMLSIALFVSNDEYYVKLRMTLVGILMLLIPLSKIQLIPLQFVSYIYLSYWLYDKKLIYLSRYIVIGFIIALFLLVSFIIKYDCYDEMVYYYWIRNMGYSDGNLFANFQKLISGKELSLLKEGGLLNAIVIILIAFFFNVTGNIRKLLKTKKMFLIFSFILISVVYLSIFKSGKNYTHYFFLLFYPIFFLSAWVLNFIHKGTIIYKISSLLLVFNGLYYMYINFEKQKLLPIESGIVYNYSITDEHKVSNIIKGFVKKYRLPQDASLVIWGKDISINLLSKLNTATPDSHIDYLCCSSINNVNNTFSRYFQKFKFNKPIFFVVNQNNEKEFYDLKFSPLQSYVKDNYILIVNENRHKIFIRRDYVALK